MKLQKEVSKHMQSYPGMSLSQQDTTRQVFNQDQLATVIGEKQANDLVCNLYIEVFEGSAYEKHISSSFHQD